MSPSQKRVLQLLALISLVYFVALAFPNVTGARDANMLAVFETDEFAQYPHVMRMLTPGDTFYQSIRNFAVYQHYFYGYPFYFFSALALLPLRLLGGADWAASTPVILLILRQLINVLPAILAAGLLTWTQTRFKPGWLAAALFAFLLIIPAVLVNNLWWHVDALLLLFIALTFFFLDRDGLRFGRNVYFAAAACGLATGTKHMGLFFFLAIPAYLLYGLALKKISLRRAALAGLLFVAVMVGAIVISNPLLLLPQERAEIISVQRAQWQQTTQGYWTVNQEPYFQWGKPYPEDFRLHYGESFFVLLALIALGMGFFQPERRLLSLLVLAWCIPYLTYFLAVAATHRTHYFLPAALPLFSCLAAFFRPLPTLAAPGPGRLRFNEQTGHMARWAAGLLILAQAGLFLWQDGRIYLDQLNRERTSPGLAFSRQVDERVFAALPDPGRNWVVYHDWKVYIPDRAGLRVEMNWDLATKTYIADLQPDIILLENANLEQFTAPDALERALDAGGMAALVEFYSAAAADRLDGYRRVYADSFGVIFVSVAMFDNYFKK